MFLHYLSFFLEINTKCYFRHEKNNGDLYLMEENLQSNIKRKTCHEL